MIKHKHDKLQIFTAIVAILALLVSVANLIYIINSDKFLSANSLRGSVNSARIDQLIKCVQGNKNLCDILKPVEPDGVLK